jgi:hypothetical protein
MASECVGNGFDCTPIDPIPFYESARMLSGLILRLIQLGETNRHLQTRGVRPAISGDNPVRSV